MDPHTPDLMRELLTPASKEAYWQRVGYQPHPAQIDVHQSDARFKALSCGRRWGKTQCGPRDIGPLIHVPDGYIWIVAPTYDLALKEFRLFHRDLTLMKKQGHISLEKAVMDPVGKRFLLKVRGGATIEVKSQEKADQLVGEGLVAVIMAEAARLKPYIWTELIRPTLADSRGVAIFPSTPRGKNWFKTLYDRGQDEDRADWDSWYMPSWANPVLFPGGENDQEIQDMKADMGPQEFAQEIAAEWVSFEGQVYEEFDEQVHVDRFEPMRSAVTYGAVDFGFVDPFVVLAIQHDADGRIYVLDEYWHERMTPAEHAKRIRDHFERPEGAGAVPEFLDCDPRDPAAIKELRQADWSAKAAPGLDKRRLGENPIQWGIWQIKRLLEVREDGLPRLMVHRRCRNLIQEFNTYEYEDAESKRREQPKDASCHGLDALRYHVVSRVARRGPSIDILGDDEDPDEMELDDDDLDDRQDDDDEEEAA